MSNIVNREPTNESGLYIAPSHDEGGVRVVVDDSKVVEIEGNEIIAGGSSVIYCILRNFVSNGLQFADYAEKGKETFFWDYRGMITHRTFEKKDVFERNDILRISIKRLE